MSGIINDDNNETVEAKTTEATTEATDGVKTTEATDGVKTTEEAKAETPVETPKAKTPTVEAADGEADDEYFVFITNGDVATATTASLDDLLESTTSVVSSTQEEVDKSGTGAGEKRVVIKNLGDIFNGTNELPLPVAYDAFVHIYRASREYLGLKDEGTVNETLTVPIGSIREKLTKIKREYEVIVEEVNRLAAINVTNGFDTYSIKHEIKRAIASSVVFRQLSKHTEYQV